MMRSHREGVSTAVSNDGWPSLPSVGIDVVDEALDDRPDTGDIGVGDNVMAETVASRKKTLQDESRGPVAPSPPSHEDPDD